MPSAKEYEQILDEAMGGILEMRANSKAGIFKLMSEARRRVIRKRNELTKGISERWKGEFAKIKAENDEWQMNLKIGFEQVEISIEDTVNDLIEGLQV